MKKFFVVVFSLLCLNVFATEYEFFQGTYYEYNMFTERFDETEYQINYETETDLYYLTMSDFIETKVLVFNNDNIAALQKNITKYIEWEDLALSKQLTLKKQLPNSDITVIYLDLMGNSVYSSKNFVLNFTFFSQNVDVHQLVISAKPVTSEENTFMDCSIEELYFCHDQIIELQNALSAENIAAKKKEFEEQAAIEDLFR